MRAPSGKQAGLVALAAAAILAAGFRQADSATAAVDRPRAALNVTTAKPQAAEWPHGVHANGSIAAWQEAIVGAQLSGLQLSSVRVNVGDVVVRGQVLASFDHDGIDAMLAEQRAAVDEAEAALAVAQTDAERARTLRSTGALSTQQIIQLLSAERSAKARLDSAKARLQTETIRKRHTSVVASDDGIISARSATVGAVAQQGQELFRLIRQNRLEWRAEVTADDLLRIRPGQTVKLTVGSAHIGGKVRVAAPSIDPRTRTALVYVDLPPGSQARAGMFAGGEFELERSSALTVPQDAVVLRDGFSFVFLVGVDHKVAQKKVSLGRRLGKRVEVTGGLHPAAVLVTQGAGFLADGDRVLVVDAATVTAGRHP